MKTSFEQNQHSIRDLFIETALLIKTNPGDAHLWNNMRDIFSIEQQMDLSSLVRHQLFPAEALQWDRLHLEAYCDIRILMIDPDRGLTWAALGDAFSAGVEFESLKIPGKTTFFTRHIQQGDIRSWKKTDYVAYCDAQALSIEPERAYVWANLANGFKNRANFSKLATSSQSRLFPPEARVWNAEKFLSHCYKQVKYIFSNENTSHVNAFFNQKKRRLTPQKPIGLHPLLIMRLGEKARTIPPTPMNAQGCTTFFPKNQLIKTNQNAPLSQLYREPVRQPQFRELEKMELVNLPAPSDYRAMVNTFIGNDFSAAPPMTQQQPLVHCPQPFVNSGSFLMPSAIQQVQLCENREDSAVSQQNYFTNDERYQQNPQPYLRNKRSRPFPHGDQRESVEQAPTKRFRQGREADGVSQQYEVQQASWGYSLRESHSQLQKEQTVQWGKQWDELNLPHLNETFLQNIPCPMPEQPLAIRNSVSMQPVVISVDSEIHPLNYTMMPNAPELMGSNYVYEDGSSVLPDAESKIVSKSHGIGVRYFLNGEPVFMRNKHKRMLYDRQYEFLKKNQYVYRDGASIPENEIANIVKAASGEYFLHGEKVMTLRAYGRMLNREQHNAHIYESITNNFQTGESNTSQDFAIICAHDDEPSFSNQQVSHNYQPAGQILPEIIQEKHNEFGFFQLVSEPDPELSSMNNGSPVLFDYTLL